MKILLLVIGIFVGVIVLYAIINYFIMKDVTTPNYSVIKKAKNIEIRQYQPMLTADVKVTGNRKDAASKGFKQLADFIFGNNNGPKNDTKKIAMTAPVLQQESQKITMTAPVMQTKANDNSWIVKFVMPAEYSMQNLPKPNNPEIHIHQIPTKKMIAIRFSGMSSKENLQQHKLQLENYIKQHNITIIGSLEYAFYNPPWTLPMLRRNEILVTIK